MNLNKQSIAAVLSAAGWRELPVGSGSTGQLLLAAFTCSFATVAFVPLDNAVDVAARWAECQVQFGHLVEQGKAAHRKDLYLVFLVPHIAKEAESGLSVVLGDTHVCRKICVEIRGREFAEVLKELPFVARRSSDCPPSAGNVIPLLAAVDLASDLKDDLGKRSAPAILKKLLDGKYAQIPKRK